MKDKKVVIAIIVVILLILAGGAYYFVAGRSGSSDTDDADTGYYEDEYQEITKEELGLEVEARSDKKAVKFTINKTEGIEAVEYELTYVAGDGQQRGVIGTVEFDEGAEVIESKYLDLGSCSSGVCKYDSGVEEVTLLLKVTKDRKVYQAKDTITL